MAEKVTVTVAEPPVYPEAEPVIVASPVVEELLKTTVHAPVDPVVQLEELNEPKVEEKEIVTPDFVSDVAPVMVDV